MFAAPLFITTMAALAATAEANATVDEEPAADHRHRRARHQDTLPRPRPTRRSRTFHSRSASSPGSRSTTRRCARSAMFCAIVPGARAAQGEGHRDQIVLRGNNSTADFFVDGLRDDVQYYPRTLQSRPGRSSEGPQCDDLRARRRRRDRQPRQQAAGRQICRAGAVSADSEGAWHWRGRHQSAARRRALGRLNAVYEKFDNLPRRI